MFKKFWGGLKDMGKRAIGYIKGMNGHKAAAALLAALEGWQPGSSAFAAPLATYLGGKANELMDYISDGISQPSGGIRKRLIPPRGLRRENY